MNLWTKTVIASALDRTGLLAAFRRARSSSHGIVLAFHRVLRDRDIDLCYDSHLATSQSVFEELMILLRSEFDVISLDQLVHHSGENNHRQRVAITFDDGWEDTYSVAFPLLLQYDIPATVFLCTALLSEDDSCLMLPEERFARLWERCSRTERVPSLLEDLRKWGVAESGVVNRREWSVQLKKMCLHSKLLLLAHLEETYRPPKPCTRRFINWEEARIMARHNITIGSHTAAHCTLSSERDETVLDELSRSRAQIIDQVGGSAEFLAYPNGAYNSRVLLAARAVGFTHAFTTETGLFHRKTDPFRIPRIAMDDTVIANPPLALNVSRTHLCLQVLRRRASSC
jgi:peptidoglycan/xylan/chitin deacetylase (PgdA/CDA1 family)